MSGQQVGPMAQYSQRERRELLSRIAELEGERDGIAERHQLKVDLKAARAEVEHMRKRIALVIKDRDIVSHASKGAATRNGELEKELEESRMDCINAKLERDEAHGAHQSAERSSQYNFEERCRLEALLEKHGISPGPAIRIGESKEGGA